jgi:hypothetical protein
MTGERTGSERLLHETVCASVLPRHLGHRHLHTHIFAYANRCVNAWWIAERPQIGTTARTTSGYLETWHRIDVWPDSIQVFGGSLSLAAAHHVLVWLSSGLRSAEHRGEAWLKRGLPSSK